MKSIGSFPNKKIAIALLAIELVLGYGVFAIYPVLTSIMFGSDAPIYAHANVIARAISPLIILLFNIVIFLTNLDTRQKSRSNSVNRSLGMISGVYFGCYILFLFSLALMAHA